MLRKTACIFRGRGTACGSPGWWGGEDRRWPIQWWWIIQAKPVQLRP